MDNPFHFKFDFKLGVVNVNALPTLTYMYIFISFNLMHFLRCVYSMLLLLGVLITLKFNFLLNFFF